MEIITPTVCSYCKDETNQAWNCWEDSIVCGVCPLFLSVTSAAVAITSGLVVMLYLF